MKNDSIICNPIHAPFVASSAGSPLLSFFIRKLFTISFSQIAPNSRSSASILSLCGGKYAP